MSTLILQAAGSVVGAAVGGPVGALVGRSIGALAGAALDSRLFSSPRQIRQVEGPRLKTMAGLSSTEGASIPRVYGRARIGGEIIWATRFVEVVTTQTSGGGRRGGKSHGGGGTRTPVTVTTTYSYYANLAVGLCEGPIAAVRRVWADGTEIDLTGVTMRVNLGDESQDPDPLLVAKQGSGKAPAYRGTAYVVFEMLPLAAYGNRIPQLSFEVVRPVSRLAQGIRAVQVIPGAGEAVYQPGPLQAASGGAPVNRHQLFASADWRASIDQLQALCPKLERVGLVVSWFGDDLRAGSCTIRPKVNPGAPETTPAWFVAGLQRLNAQAVSLVDGIAAFGGTPSDDSVQAAIQDLKARGLAVTLYPFVQMDIPAGNGRPDPWTGGANQPVYPWRGRITGSKAPGQSGSPDGTAAAEAEIQALFGQAAPAHFAVVDGRIAYSGPVEWSLRRQVLHYAALAKMVGGVDTLLIGSEFASLTRLRDATGGYPAVTKLRQLAEDVRAMLGPSVALSYAADWTEYGSHVPAAGELRFPLDLLWASPAIDAVSIDAWWPLADWREGTAHLDASVARSACDPAYLLSNVSGGEGFDWYYADDAGRAAQDRHPITDGAYGKPFVYRPKDLKGWWSNPHVERVGGVEKPVPTAWVPFSKPIWLNEVGCPAIDKGANRPSAFPDPKSSEASLPPFSSGLRDDLMLHRGATAMLARYDPAMPGYKEGSNPPSAVPGGFMVNPSRIHVWAWDARPFPAFPRCSSVWADAASWATGHWLTGRLEGAPIEDLLAALLADTGGPGLSQVAADGYLDGYVVDRPMSARAALEPLAGLFGIDPLASAGALRFMDRRGIASVTLGPDDLVPLKNEALFERTRMQDTDLPHEIALGFMDAEVDYGRATVSSRRLAGRSRRFRSVEVNAILTRAEAGRLADIALHDAWAARESVVCHVRPGLLALEPGDLVRFDAMEGANLYRIEQIRDAETREITARAIEPSMYTAPGRAMPLASDNPPLVAGRPAVEIVDWPGVVGDPAPLQSLAVSADPWPGGMAVWRSVDGSSFDIFATVSQAATIGTLIGELGPGPLWRFDDGPGLVVELDGGVIPATTDVTALQGDTTLAVRSPSGQTEVVAFARAELVGERTWRLTRLLRGLGGSEAAALGSAPAGSRVVLLDAAPLVVARAPEGLGQSWRYRVGPTGRDVADPAMVSLTATPTPAALLPLAPVRVTARRVAGGIEVAWLRRGRTDSDSWEPVDIPLGEEVAAFDCAILSKSDTILRTLTGSASPLLYAAADELADFGAAQSVLSVRLAQRSAVVGPGLAFSGFLTVG